VTPCQIEDWLDPFALDQLLRPHITAVMLALPSTVREDLMTDPSFRMCDYEPGLAVIAHVPVGMPTRNNPSRSIVLKRTLRRRSEDFVRYVIAHEVAHAHLRNRGRTPGEDPEHAADALAAEWGFAKPQRVSW
jgi:hypothetical protein